ncbi:MAG: SH3 domain-containing protein [Leptospiraceae bacterium]|nr:SH3 domain-containing protein [Leptospiraceae bacterium]
MREFLIFILIFWTYFGNCKDTFNSDRKSDSNLDEYSDGVPNDTVEVADSLPYYVNAPSGLILREDASLTSKKIDLLPNRTPVEISQVGMDPIEIDGNTGFWIGVRALGKDGFVFSYYLSSIDPGLPVESIWDCEYHSNFGTGNSDISLYFFEDKTYIKTAFLEEWINESIAGNGTYTFNGRNRILKNFENEIQELFFFEDALFSGEDLKKIQEEPGIIERLDDELQSDEFEDRREESISICTPRES